MRNCVAKCESCGAVSDSCSSENEVYLTDTSLLRSRQISAVDFNEAPRSLVFELLRGIPLAVAGRYFRIGHCACRSCGTIFLRAHRGFPRRILLVLTTLVFAVPVVALLCQFAATTMQLVLGAIPLGILVASGLTYPIDFVSQLALSRIYENKSSVQTNRHCPGCQSSKFRRACNDVRCFPCKSCEVGRMKFQPSRESSRPR